MNKAKRRVVIAGNWKMNKNRAEAKVLITELLPLVKEAGCEVVLCTPYTNLETALALTEGSNVKVGAENCHWAESGAFTGEISAPMPPLVINSIRVDDRTYESPEQLTPGA